MDAVPEIDGNIPNRIEVFIDNNENEGKL